MMRMNRLTKYFLVVLLALTGMAMVWMFVLAVTAGSREQFFANGGYDLFVPPNPDTGEKASQVMVMEPCRAIFHLFVVILLGGAIIVNLLWFNGATRPLVRWGCCGVLALILYVEQWSATTHFFDYYSPSQLYADNAIFQKLRNTPGRQRVAMLTRAGYYNTWLSLHLPYFDIDCVDIPAASRPPADYTAFFGALDPVPMRKWELCATRYMLGPKNLGLQFFRSQKAETLVRPVVELDIPQLGTPTLFEYAQALPRAVVLHRWEIIKDADKLLARLADPRFDPHATVLLDTAPSIQPDPEAPASTAVDIVSFKPAHVVLKTTMKSPGILLMTDYRDMGWTATVDGQPATIQTGNYLMRAVVLPSGDHQVVFRYSGQTAMWWLTWGIWSAIAVGLVASVVRWLKRRA